MTLYENVIVPFDGSLPAGAALAPAADLAWRCGARLVIVNNTEVSDRASRDALKARAMSMSGPEVDFWVDTDGSVGQAVVRAAEHRSAPVVCLPVRAKTSGFRRKPVLQAMAAEVLREAPAPVLVMGPAAEVGPGLPLGEIVVSLDGSTESEHVLPLAVAWARALKLRLSLVGVVREGAGGQERHRDETSYLEQHLARVRDEVPDASFELIEAVDPCRGLVERLRRGDQALAVMSTHGRSGADDSPLGGVAQSVLVRSSRPMLFARPPG